MPLEAQLKQYNDENNTNFHFSELLSGNCVEKIPREAGVYAWYFKNIPDNVPIDDCEKSNDLTLLYIGMAGGKQTLYQRIKTKHYNGRVANSTLRHSLISVISNNSSIVFSENELTKWMCENAYVAFCVCTSEEQTHQLEIWLIKNKNLSLPLNLKGNKGHKFYKRLKAIRTKFK
jgi:hypothetical protein